MSGTPDAGVRGNMSTHHGPPTDTAQPGTPLRFSRGLREGLSIFIGYLPIALAFGLLAKNTGVSLAHTVGMSLLVFAGASQFMALELIALGTGGAEIVFSTFIVNIRHLLMSMSVNERALPEGRGRKGLYAFFITDEVFAVAATKDSGVGSGYLFGLGIMAYLGWTLNTAVGYVAGALLPVTLQEGMAVALYAMFIGLLIPSVKRHRRALYLAVTAALLNWILLLVLPPGWAIIAAAVGAVAGLELFEARLRRADEAHSAAAPVEGGEKETAE